MSSEQPKLNNSEVNNNSTSGESRDCAATERYGFSTSTSTSTTAQMNLTSRTKHAPTSTSVNSSISSNRNRPLSKKAKLFAALSWA